MSCNCNAKYDNKVPCCCSTGTPVICTTTECPDAQPCDETLESDCVIYNGNDYDCAGIQNGMTVTQVMNSIFVALNLIDCTTTTTLFPTCQCYFLENTEETIVDYSFTTCLGEYVETILNGLQRTYVCSLTPIVSDPGIVVTPSFNLVCSDRGGTCSNPASYCYTLTVVGSSNFNYVNAFGYLEETGVVTDATLYLCAWENSIVKIPDTGTSSFTLVNSNNFCTINGDCLPISARCTAGDGLPEGYYSMERLWDQPTYTYTLNSMVLNGVEYASGQSITINTATDLVTGISPIDGLPYIMNLSDWLNSIAGFSTSGFMFHDDMHVIDKPTVASTYAIEIGMVNAGSSFTYYYSSTNGFEFGNGAVISQLGTYTCEPTVSVYSQVVSFSTPMNSIIYRCDGTQVAVCYGSNQTNLNNLVNMFNSNPPVASNACFLGYGNYFNNGDGRVRLQIPVGVFNSLCPTGTLTLEVIYD